MLMLSHRSDLGHNKLHTYSQSSAGTTPFACSRLWSYQTEHLEVVIWLYVHLITIAYSTHSTILQTFALFLEYGGQSYDNRNNSGFRVKLISVKRQRLRRECWAGFVWWRMFAWLNCGFFSHINSHKSIGFVHSHNARYWAGMHNDRAIDTWRLWYMFLLHADPSLLPDQFPPLIMNSSRSSRDTLP